MKNRQFGDLMYWPFFVSKEALILQNEVIMSLNWSERLFGPGCSNRLNYFLGSCICLLEMMGAIDWCIFLW